MATRRQQNKTQPTEVDPAAYVAAVAHPVRRADAEALLEMMARITGYPPKMWGPSIVGFGRYHYRYDTGREGEFLITGFSPRKANLVVYVLPGYDDMSNSTVWASTGSAGAASTSTSSPTSMSTCSRRSSPTASRGCGRTTRPGPSDADGQAMGRSGSADHSMRLPS